jgi:hypothetical protein
MTLLEVYMETLSFSGLAGLTTPSLVRIADLYHTAVAMLFFCRIELALERIQWQVGCEHDDVTLGSTRAVIFVSTSTNITVNQLRKPCAKLWCLRLCYSRGKSGCEQERIASVLQLSWIRFFWRVSNQDLFWNLDMWWDFLSGISAYLKISA